MPNAQSKSIEVVAAMLITNNKVFIARRHPNGSQGGLWEFPGGKIEAMETPQQALKRELQEELSVSVTVGIYLASSHHRYSDKQVNLHGYRCHWHGDEIKLTGSHDQYLWVTPTQIDRTTLAPADLPLLDALIADLTLESRSTS